MIAYWLAIYAWFRRLIQEVILNVLSAGPVPRHVAFVMDGNRRFARRSGKRVLEGHSAGFIALRRVLEICLKLNIPCVSVYAFAINNFQRSQEEVDALMKLAEEKLVELSQHGDILQEYGVRLNVLGNIELLPHSVRNAVRKAENSTRENKRAILNICMPYDSRYEITSAVRSSVRMTLESNPMDPSHLTEEVIESQLLTSLKGSPPLDILIRTSGVKRISGFLQWQCCEDTQIYMVDSYWPDFDLTDFIPVLLAYQQKVWARRRDKAVTRLT